MRKSRLVAYGAALERRFGGNSIVGSNPTSSAKLMNVKTPRFIGGFFDADTRAGLDVYNLFFWGFEF
jgi:hypothetical protein